MMWIVLCDKWIPHPPHDNSLVGFPDRETAEFWRNDADKVCAGNHYVVRVIPE